MGYYTEFKLKWYRSKNFIGVPCECKILEDLKEISEYSWMKYEEERIYSEEAIRWYDWEKDMKKLSKKYPKILFELLAEGEESGDMWKARFKDGLMEKVEVIISFPEFKKLKVVEG